MRSERLTVLSKRILLFALTVITAAFQNTNGLLPSVFGLRFFPLIPLTVSIGMCEGEISGLLYGAAAGIFWDICSASPEGFCAFYLALLGALSGVLIKFYLRLRTLTQYVITAISSVCFFALYYLFTVFIPIGDKGFNVLLSFYLPSAVMTTAFSFIPYSIVKFLSGTLKGRVEN